MSSVSTHGRCPLSLSRLPLCIHTNDVPGSLLRLFRASHVQEGKSKQPRKHSEELRAVIAITRHGDRTPKQKMKMNISFPPFLAFYNKYSPGNEAN